MVRRRKKRILIFTIPNDGHLNILRRVIRDAQDTHDFGLVLVDQKNGPADLRDVGVPVYRPRRAREFVNTPASRVFARVAAVLDECLEIARAFSPDLVLYDFCALEGHFVGQILGLRSWSSVPGLVGPLTEHGYLAECLASPANQTAIAAIRARYGIPFDPAEVELISNSLHIPGERNILWSYPKVTPHNFLSNRQPARYQFAGYLSDGHVRSAEPPPNPTVYLSFGTEVMDNLWSAQEETRAGVRTTVAGLARRWAALDLDVVFATQDKHVLDAYPGRWTVQGKVDQQRVLSRSDIFVTHGGSNSLHESLLAKVPMVVTPFFGDQPLAGRRVEELGVGIALVDDAGIDTGKSKHFLTDELAVRIDGAVRRILADRRFNDRLHSIELEGEPALAALGE